MSKLTKEITQLNKMLDSVGTDLGIDDFNPTEFSIFFDIIQRDRREGQMFNAQSSRSFRQVSFNCVQNYS